jgi:hypothetical protein
VSFVVGLLTVATAIMQGPTNWG